MTTTSECAFRALRALKCGDYKPTVEGEDAVSDLLADLMHYCARTGTEWQKVMETAYVNFDAEVNGESETRR